MNLSFFVIFTEEKCEINIWWKNNECTVGKESEIIESDVW